MIRQMLYVCVNIVQSSFSITSIHKNCIAQALLRVWQRKHSHQVSLIEQIDSFYCYTASTLKTIVCSGRTQDVATKQTNASTGASRRTRCGASEAAATGTAAAAVALLSLVQLQSTRMTTFSTENWSSLTTTKLLLLLYTFNNYRKQEGALLPSLLLVATQFGGQPPPRNGAMLQSSGAASRSRTNAGCRRRRCRSLQATTTTSLFLERVDSQSVK